MFSEEMVGNSGSGAPPMTRFSSCLTMRTPAAGRGNAL